MTTFSAWLFEQRDRRDPLGDLAWDAVHDDGWPTEATTREEVAAYLRSVGASPDVMGAAVRAWAEYQQRRKA